MARRGGCLLAVLLLLCTAALGEEFRPLAMDLSGGAPLQKKYMLSQEVYEDPTIRVEVHRVESPITEWHVLYYYALIRIQDPSQLRTAPADGTSFTSGALVPAAAMARRMNAVLAINGDYCAPFTGKQKDKYVLRQGTVYRDSTDPSLDLLLIDEKGDFHVIQGSSEIESMDKTTVDGRKVINALQFGPALVIDGEKVADEILLDRAHSPHASEPDSGWPQRMCIAQIDELTYMALCCRNGLTLVQLRDLAMSLADCRVVYNLDGGESTQMIFLNSKYNNPKGSNNPRPITDILYFASAWFE